jgi:hypothetical protein
MSKWLKDTVERVVFTFLEAFLAVVVASGQDWIDVSTAQAAAVAGGAAALAVLKAAIASRKTDTVSPASLAPDSAEG